MKTAYSITVPNPLPARQRGAVTLLVAVLALVLVTIMTVYTANVGVMDQRMAGNEFRYRQAAAAAEGGLNQAVAYFRADPSLIPNTSALNASAAWTTAGNYTEMVAGPITLANGSQISWARAIHCTQAIVTDVCPQPTVGGVAATSYNYNVFRAQGVVTDSAGTTEATAVVQQQIAFSATTGSSAPNAPVVAAGNVQLNGNFNIVANPDGGSKADCTESDCTAQGVAVSVWTSATATAGGSSSTCSQSGFSGSACTSDYLSSGGTTSTDVVASDPTVSNGGNFPDDVFQYLFNETTANYQNVKNRAIQITDCGSSKLNTSSVGLYWYTGAECQVDGPTVGASEDNSGTANVAEGPVILVVQDADFRMNANTTFNGIVFIFSSDGVTQHAVKTNGSALLNGVLMTNVALDSNINGTFTAKYDADILEQLAPSSNNMNNGPANGTPSDVPGSWRDF